MPSVVIQVVVLSVPTVLVRVNVHLVSCLGFWLTDNNEPFVLQLTNLIFLEGSHLGIRIRTVVLLFHFPLFGRISGSFFISLLVFRSVGPLLSSFFVVSVFPEASSIVTSPLSLDVILPFSVVVFSSIRSVVFSGLRPLLLNLLIFFASLLRSLIFGGTIDRGRVRLLFFLIVNNRDSDLLNNSVMNLLNYLYFFRVTLLVSSLFMKNYDLVSMYFILFLLNLFLRSLLFNWSLGIFIYESCQSFLKFVITGKFFECCC